MKKTEIKVVVDHESFTVGVSGEGLSHISPADLEAGVFSQLIVKGHVALGSFPVASAYYTSHSPVGQALIWYAESGFPMSASKGLAKAAESTAAKWEGVIKIVTVTVQEGEWNGLVENTLDSLSHAFETVGMKPVEI